MRNRGMSAGVDSNVFVGIDLGAESLRVFTGFLGDKTLRIDEVFRHPNSPVEMGGVLHWDVETMFERIKEALLMISKKGFAPRTIGIDTWGVDFGLFDAIGKLVEKPFCYRDERNQLAMDEFLKVFPRERLYDLTGIQIMPFNSVFQMYACSKWNPDFLSQAEDLLFMPDIFNYFLTGRKATEFTFATTSQLYNPKKATWEDEILSALGISRKIFQEIIPPATVIGGIGPSCDRELDLGDVRVVAVASHDTASAVAAVPASGESWAYISSGTWSLMGIELDKPCISEVSLKHNFTNEGGMGGRFRFLKNICGLWLLRRCRDEWLREGKGFSYDDIIEMAKISKPFLSLINPDDPRFYNPYSMTGAIGDFCRETGQDVPDSPGQYVRVILESLALKYRYVLEEIDSIFPGKVRRVHIVGGGGKNRLLNQFTADATGLEVLSGPYEATVVGNIMAQAVSVGLVDDLEEMRAVVGRSFPVEKYRPLDVSAWDRAFERFKKFSVYERR